MRKAVARAGKRSSSAPEALGLSSERLERIGRALEPDIAQGRIAGAVVLVARHGKVAFWEAFGKRAPDGPEPLKRDDIFRIYSMTKPICSVAVMMLVEEGRLLLTDPIGQFAPALAKLQVAVPQGPLDSGTGAGGPPRLALEPARADITIQDLLRHTAGFTYGFRGTHVKALYEEAEKGMDDKSNGEVMEVLGRLPLAFQPGTTWEYSRATDVLGYVVEAIAGQPLGDFLRERILGPLGMSGTGFSVPEKHWSRIAQPAPDPATGKPQAVLDVKRPRRFESGGGGLVSTAGDYLRFAQMLLNGGELDGVRLLSPRTVAWMTADHLGPGVARGVDYLPGPGYGFGLGFGVREAAGLSPLHGSAGDYFWGGAAGTYFWIDPREQLIGILMVQAPSLRLHYRRLVKNLVLGAVVE